MCSTAQQGTAPPKAKPSFIHQPTTADLSLPTLGRASWAGWIGLFVPMPDASTRGDPHRWMGLVAPMPEMCARIDQSIWMGLRAPLYQKYYEKLSSLNEVSFRMPMCDVMPYDKLVWASAPE